MVKLHLITLFTLLLSYSPYTQSATWSSTLVEYLRGSTFADTSTKEKNDQYDTVTLQHASGWKYGDNFFFTDVTRLSSKISSYAEFSTRVSSKKIFEIDYGTFITDILLAATVEMPAEFNRTDLIGLGLDIAIPGFNFINLNFYLRNSKNNPKSTYQVTLVWDATFDLGIKLRFAGFLDHAGKAGNTESYIFTQPQLLWVISQEVEAGLELQYSKNKYGIKDVTDTVPQLLIRWNL